MTELSMKQDLASPSEGTQTSRRSRGSRVVVAVLDATIALLAERGYSFSVEDVATRARVHKTTIYRRFTTTAVLVGAAIERLGHVRVPISESSDPLEDLATLAVAVAEVLSSPDGGRIIRAVVSAASEDPEVLTVARRFLAGRFDAATQILGRAINSGQLRAGTDAVLLWGAIVNPLQVRALLGHPASESTARELLALVLDGAHGAGVTAHLG